jgi:biopolymer transport protein ExbB
MSAYTRVAAALALAAVLAPASTAHAQAKPRSDRLTEAYKREFAFLEAEKRQLAQRLEEEKRDGEARMKAARDEIATLQDRVVGSSAEADRLEQLVLDADRELDSMDQSDDVIGDLLLRANTAFDKLDIRLPEVDAGDRGALVGQVAFAFAELPKALARLGQVRVEDGAYFADNGEKVAGRVMYVGNIAAYGLVEGAEGPLSPAGQDRLKLWPVEGGPAAAAKLARGEALSSLPVFIYETLDKGIDQRRDKTPGEVLQAGGVIAYVIVALGIVALAMVILRALLLLRASLGNHKVLEPILELVERGKIEMAIDIARNKRNSAGRVLHATLSNLDRGREQLEDVVAEAVLHEQPTLSRFGSAIMVVAAVSPLLGLLGTVTGMISTFEIITEFGTGNPKLLSGGISEALITTELGLVVAIPALLVGHVLSGWSDRIRDGLDASALAAVNRAAGLKSPSASRAKAVEPELAAKPAA